jgi:hypothetical protein
MTTRPLQTHLKEINNISLIEEIVDKDVLLAIQKMSRRTCRQPNNTPRAPVEEPDKRERVEPFENSESKQVEKDECLSVQKKEVASTASTFSTATSSLDPTEAHPEESEPSSSPSLPFGKQNVIERSSCTGSSKAASSCRTMQPKNQKKAPILPIKEQIKDLTTAVSVLEMAETYLDKKMNIIFPDDAISSFLSIVNCQDNDIYTYDDRYDDASMKEDQNFLSLFGDDGTVLAAHDKLPLKASRDPEVIPREVALINSLSSVVPKEGETLKIHALSSEDGIEHIDISHPPENGISSFLTIVAYQDNGIYRYDDASTKEDQSSLSLLVDDGTVLATLDEPPLKASRGPQVIFREVALINSLSSVMPKEGGNQKILGLSNEDGIAPIEISHPPENSISRALEASKNYKESLPPRPKTPSIFSGTFSKHEDAAVKTTPTRHHFVETKQRAPSQKRSSSEGQTDSSSIDQGFKNEILSKGSVESVWPHKLSKTGKKHDGEGDGDFPPTPPRTPLGNLKSASQLFVKQDAEKWSLVGTLPKAKGCRFDLTNFSVAFDGQNADADCQALFGEAKSEGLVQEKPAQAAPTLQGADQPDNQLVSEGIEVAYVIPSRRRKKAGN